MSKGVNGLKLSKINQLGHFVEQVYSFGSASNISGRVDETNLKEKVKDLPKLQQWNYIMLIIGLPYKIQINV